MSGDHAKKEMETGEKPTTSHGSTSSEESRTKRKEKKKSSSNKGKEKKSSSHHKEKKEKSSSHKPHRSRRSMVMKSWSRSRPLSSSSCACRLFDATCGKRISSPSSCCGILLMKFSHDL